MYGTAQSPQTRTIQRVVCVRYLVVGVRGEFVSNDDVRGEEELDTLLSSDLLEFAGKLELEDEGRGREEGVGIREKRGCREKDGRGEDVREVMRKGWSEWI